jgi:hypothetical protein
MVIQCPPLSKNDREDECRFIAGFRTVEPATHADSTLPPLMNGINKMADNNTHGSLIAIFKSVKTTIYQNKHDNY